MKKKQIISLQKILVIQTAFIGDVILSTGIVEKLNSYYPEAQIDFLLRKGNESLLTGHPFLNRLLIWDKKKDKYKNLWKMLKQIRDEKYDLVINLQRFAASGILTALSGAKTTNGYDKNPFSAFFSKSFPHKIGNKGDKEYLHETERNHSLIRDITDNVPGKPVLYPSISDFESVNAYKSHSFVTISPASVWFTKQYPKERWVEFINGTPVNYQVYLTGGPGDIDLCAWIRQSTSNLNVHILAGQLSFLQTAALMKDAVMNYTNDSAPMHLASAMDAPVTAVYCSTIPEFGFGPLSSKSFIIQTEENLECRPCGLHGFKECPQGHFKCAYGIVMKFDQAEQGT
jgi:heptosyltransferase II